MHLHTFYDITTLEYKLRVQNSKFSTQTNLNVI